MAIISRCDVSELFELFEAALDEIALFLLILVVIDDVASV